MLMIIKNITSLTGLQILRPAGSSGGDKEWVGAGGISWILDCGLKKLEPNCVVRQSVFKSAIRNLKFVAYPPAIIGIK